MAPLAVIRAALSRIIAIREECDPIVRELALEDLEIDLAGSLAALEREAE